MEPHTPTFTWPVWAGAGRAAAPRESSNARLDSMATSIVAQFRCGRRDAFHRKRVFNAETRRSGEEWEIKGWLDRSDGCKPAAVVDSYSCPGFLRGSAPTNAHKTGVK